MFTTYQKTVEISNRLSIRYIHPFGEKKHLHTGFVGPGQITDLLELEFGFG